MTIDELNQILWDGYPNCVRVSKDIYPEVEELYILSPSKFDKNAVAKLYYNFDYQGIRNCLEIARNKERFDKYYRYMVYEDKPIEISPSQGMYLELLGWNIKNIDCKFTQPWVAR